MIKPTTYGYPVNVSTAQEAINESIKLDGYSVCLDQYGEHLIEDLLSLSKSHDIDDNVIQIYGNHNYEHPWIVTVVCRETLEKEVC